MLSFRSRKMTASIFKPLLQRLVLLVGEGRVQMFDRDVGRGDQNRLGVRERVEAILSVVVAHSSQPGTAKRHGFYEQVNTARVPPLRSPVRTMGRLRLLGFADATCKSDSSPPRTD